MFNLIPKLLKSPIFFSILFLTIIMLPSVIYKSGESERLAVSVAVGIDYKVDSPTDDKIELSLMYLTPQSSSDLEKNYAVSTVTGRNVSECLNKLESHIGKEIGLSHCQVIVLSESLSEHGPIEYLDSFTRTNDLTTNALLICSDSPRKLLEAQIFESAKISISLTNILDYMSENIFTRQINLEKFYAEYYDESSVSYLPFVNTIENKKNSQEGSSEGSGGSTGGGGGDANEGSNNANSTNDQSTSGGESASQSASSGSSNSSDTSSFATVGAQGPSEQEIYFDNIIGVFKNGKLVAKLDEDSSLIFNILYSKKGTSSVVLKDIETQFAQTADLTIEIADKNEVIGYNFVGDYPVVSIDLTLYCKLAEVNAHEYTLDTVSVVNSQITDVIKKAMFEELEIKFANAINFAKDNNIDMFYVARNFYRLCTKEWEAYKLSTNADDNYMQDVLFLLNLKLVEWT